MRRGTKAAILANTVAAVEIPLLAYGVQPTGVIALFGLAAMGGSILYGIKGIGVPSSHPNEKVINEYLKDDLAKLESDKKSKSQLTHTDLFSDLSSAIISQQSRNVRRKGLYGYSLISDDYSLITDDTALDEPTVSVSKSDRWKLAMKRFENCSLKLGNYETDPSAVYFTHPLMRDVMEPATARFYDAMSAVQAVAHDEYNAKFDDVEKLDALVGAMERAWESAWENAGRKSEQGIIIGGRKLDSREKSHLATAKRALEIVLNVASTEAEAANAWDRVQRIVKSLDLSVSSEKTAKMLSENPSLERVKTAIEA